MQAASTRSDGIDHRHTSSRCFSTGDSGHRHAGGTAGLVCLPRQSPKEPPDIAGGANQVVLESDLVLSAIARLAQTIAAYQFALRSLDTVASVEDN